MTRIVVTGARGFVGASLVQRLRAQGHAVVALSRREGPGLQQVDDYAQAPDGDVLVHLAEEADRSRAAALGDAHVDAAAALLRSLVRRAGHVIYGSSGVVYGDQGEPPFATDRPVEASDPYSASKIRNEGIALDAGATVLRFSNLFGRGMSPNNVLSDIARQLGGSGPLAVRDDTPVRDFLAVDEAAEAIAAAIERRPGGIVNVGSGVGLSVRELAEVALRAAGQSGRDIVATRPAGRRSVNVLDISGTAQVLGWKPQASPRVRLERFFLDGAQP